jgi:chloramphenicol O-acetyltransferase
MVYLSTISANQVEEFRYRLRDNDTIVLHEKLNARFTYMPKDSDLFKGVSCSVDSNLPTFITAAQKEAENQESHFFSQNATNNPQNAVNIIDDFIFTSAIPWIAFTGLAHISTKEIIPRLVWGKYREQGSRILLPYSVQICHAFVDALHIAKFKEALEQNIQNIHNYL